jgi:uncharacterized damage-inducible protein DinB
MADELHRIEAQLRLAFAGEAWHGPALTEVLDGLMPEEAAAHPITGAHSIWEIALHLIGTYELVLRRLTGDGTPMTSAQDWRPVPVVAQASWQVTLEALRRANEAVGQRVLGFQSDALDTPLIPQPAFSAYTQFIGITQHDLYHAGQIVLLKRALRPPP